MFCNRCGSSNPDEVRFCVNCGAPVLAPKPQHSEAESTGYSLPRFTQERPPQQPPYGQHGYQGGYQGYQSYQGCPPMSQQQGASGRAIASMVLSLVSIVTCGPFLSIPGLILGKQELDAIRRGESPLAGEGFAKVGYYTGIIITLLSCLAGFIYLIVIALAIGGAR